jgi:hypothetical protein
MSTMSSLGDGSFKDPMRKQKMPEYDDPRTERAVKGKVAWQLERDVPDVGGLGWRSKTGHILKNQAYYRKPAHQNLWDDPIHSGVNTWKSWHGPRLRTDAQLMEKMDSMDAQRSDWEAKKAFVNTTRVQTLDRFYNRKLVREQYENSSSWAPNHRDRGEVHEHHKAFDGDINSIPIKFLKQVLTKSVLDKDREAIRAITKRIQTEETWKVAWKMMEAHRREDIQQDLEQRRMFNDVLTQMAGQPPRCKDSEHKLPNDCTQRHEELAQPKPKFMSGDVTNLADYRGLVHADCQLALETLFPGSGYQDSHEFKERARAASMPGYPPPRVETPESKPASPRKQDGSKGAPRVSMSSVPASKPRVGTICARTHDEVLALYAKEQYLPCQAPPAPDQRDTLMKEDWTKTTTQADPNRMTGTFQRKNPNDWAGTAKSQEHLPPPLRQMNYPMLAPMAEKTRETTEQRMAARATRVAINEEANQIHQFAASAEADAEALPTGRGQRKSYFQKAPEKPPVADKSAKTRPRRNSACRKAGASLSARGPSSSGFGSPDVQTPMSARGGDRGYSSITQGFIEPEPNASAVCKDLDAFEAVYEPVARLGNFFSAPHVPRPSASATAPPDTSAAPPETSEAPPAASEDPPAEPALQATGLTATGETQLTMTPKAAEQVLEDALEQPC